MEGPTETTAAGEWNHSGHIERAAPPLPPLVASTALQISVSDPQKHGEGTGSFVNYLITTRTRMESFSSPEVSALSDEFPHVILAALPGKHRMEYITGDRFSPEFIEKRKVSLENYLHRLAKHPLIAQSQTLRRFLESTEIFPELVAKAQAHVFENISDALLNAFTKIKQPDPRFIEFKEHLDKFQETLISLERLHAKLIRAETDFELDLLEFGGCISTLGLMETQINGPLTDFGNILRNLCTILRERINHEDLVYLTNVQEYIGYCMSAKETLRMRDQKQTDRGGGGIASFLTSKFQEIQGVDQERARQQKILKLSSKIAELQEAVKSSDELSKAFNNELLREIEFFHQAKLEDTKRDLKEYAINQVKYYEKCVEFWDQIVPVLENIKIDDE
ncbi:hypothetical protein BCR33DRAFT_713685 [Rhizoclosmatium globosum]|uniref:Sorting nexin-4 n=1 Tax=Rhizoclosmatium globosum TaxID=329046 RepID=A0A1Y2CQT8_9FUNG|nr:hypothetical protein BCR33DRAFT_713685 [Rhizoclosmatium globosum]|eukprot:ORY49316.1 hypothetical protein BCR33DRAFT_713685 [Rhizoclosmatium globosum]